MGAPYVRIGDNCLSNTDMSSPTLTLPTAENACLHIFMALSAFAMRDMIASSVFSLYVVSRPRYFTLFYMAMLPLCTYRLRHLAFENKIIF